MGSGTGQVGYTGIIGLRGGGPGPEGVAMSCYVRERKCQCGKPAAYYAMDPAPNGWGDFYCHGCVNPRWIKEPLLWGDEEDEAALVVTDCCETGRPEDETRQTLDGAGEPDAVVCRQGFGCEPDRAERARAEEDAYWRALDDIAREERECLS